MKRKLLNFENFLCISTVLVILIGCNIQINEESELIMSVDEKANLVHFENEFVKGRMASTRTSNPNEIQLLGFTSVEYSDDEKTTTKEVWSKVKNEITEAKCVFTTSDGSFLRVYYPLKSAVVTYNGKKYTANEDGIVVIDNVKKLSNIRIVGRKTSSRVGIGKNGGQNSVTMMFGKELLTKNIHDEHNTLVFDLGYRFQDCCNRKRASFLKSTRELGGNGGTGTDPYPGSGGNSNSVPCIRNHGIYRNCTEAFPDVSTGRCITHYDRCMDYNGYLTDCSGSHIFFAGSDCFWAMAQGECWNEINMKEL